MTNFPADETEHHTAPRHAGALADDGYEADPEARAHEAGEPERDDAYATSSATERDASDLDVNDPDVIMVNETATTSADGQDDLDGTTATPADAAYTVDSAGTAEPGSPGTDPETSPETAAATNPDTDTDADAAGEPFADAGAVDGTPVDQPVTAEPVAAGAPAPGGPASGESGPDAAATTGPPQVAEPAGSEANDLQERWLAIQSDFVNDPHRSVTAAADLVQQAIERMVADLKEQESSLRGNWDGSAADTEVLRQALVDYRQFLDRLAAV